MKMTVDMVVYSKIRQPRLAISAVRQAGDQSPARSRGVGRHGRMDGITRRAGGRAESHVPHAAVEVALRD